MVVFFCFVVCVWSFCCCFVYSYFSWLKKINEKKFVFVFTGSRQVYNFFLQHIVKISGMSAVHVYSDIRTWSSEWVVWRLMTFVLDVSAFIDSVCVWGLISDEAAIRYASPAYVWMVEKDWSARYSNMALCLSFVYWWWVVVCFSKNLPKGEIEVPKIRLVYWLHFCIIQTQTNVAIWCNMLDPMSVTSWTNMCCWQCWLFCEIW